MCSALYFFQERKADEASDADHAHHEKGPLEPQSLPDEPHGERTCHLSQFLVGSGNAQIERKGILLAHVSNERLPERSHTTNAHGHQTGRSDVEGVGKKRNEGNAEGTQREAQGDHLLPPQAVGKPSCKGLHSQIDRCVEGKHKSGLERIQPFARKETQEAEEAAMKIMANPNRAPVFGNMPRISSGFGTRRDPFTGRLARHEGLDFPAPAGTPILASAGGRVVSAGSAGAYGNAVVIDHGNGLATLYGHASRIFVRPGDLVMPQQTIAAVGSTGRSTGAHLHFEVIRNGVRVEPGRVLASVLARNAD